MIDQTIATLYDEMVETNSLIKANMLLDMYNKQSVKYPNMTEFFNKKVDELTIIELSKNINKESIGMVTDAKIDILKVKNRLSPVLTLIDITGKEIPIVLSISNVGRLQKCLNTAKCSLSILKHIGI